MTEVWIIRARRTPQGRFMGALADKTAVELALAAGRAVMSGIDPNLIDQVIVGNVLSAGLGMNVARQVGIRLGLPIRVPAYSINMMGASGMQAVRLADQAIRSGEATMVLCGGTESMSNAPYLLERARSGYHFGDGVVVDGLLRDGLMDPFGHGHMGMTADRLADRKFVSREAQDVYSMRSQARCAAAYAAGSFDDELVAVDGLERDEHPRPGTGVDTLASLEPAFEPGGTVTAGNAAGINDGATMLLLSQAEAARQYGFTPLAAVRGGTIIGCEPSEMGMGAVFATQQLCCALNTTVHDFDLIELDEAFAAQVLACVREMDLEPRRVNTNGGGIAMGHPIGASGARIVAHLAHRLARGEGRRALATLSVGGGMGAALALEAVDT